MTPGQAAYEKWRDHHNAGKFGMKLQPWSALSGAVRSIWEGVAKAAIAAARSGR